MYKYYNHNPYNISTTDCVCRAISTATGLKYEAVNNLLDMVAEEISCEKLCVCCYHNLLENVLEYERVSCIANERVKDIVDQHPRDRLIIRVDAHLTSAIKGTILDI